MSRVGQFRLVQVRLMSDQACSCSRFLAEGSLDATECLQSARPSGGTELLERRTGQPRSGLAADSLTVRGRFVLIARFVSAARAARGLRADSAPISSLMRSRRRRRCARRRFLYADACHRSKRDRRRRLGHTNGHRRSDCRVRNVGLAASSLCSEDLELKHRRMAEVSVRFRSRRPTTAWRNFPTTCLRTRGRTIWLRSATLYGELRDRIYREGRLAWA